MMPPQSRSVSSAASAILCSPSAPWRAKTFLIAAAVALLGLGLWVRDSIRGTPTMSAGESSVASPQAEAKAWNFHRPLPGATRICGSYAGAFLLGWAFRRFLKITLAVTALILGLLALGRWAGWDTRGAESQVQAGTSYFQRQAGAAKELLLGFLPSATAAGVGGFLGFRRKDPPA